MKDAWKHFRESKTGRWLRAAMIRAIKTVAQAAIASIGAGAVFRAVDWRTVISSALLAGVLSLLTSVAGLPEVKAVDTAAGGTGDTTGGGE